MRNFGLKRVEFPDAADRAGRAAATDWRVEEDSGPDGSMFGFVYRPAKTADAAPAEQKIGIVAAMREAAFMMLWLAGLAAILLPCVCVIALAGKTGHNALAFIVCIGLIFAILVYGRWTQDRMA